MATPLFRWAGSKKQLVDKLASFWGEGDNRYVEPFAGSARLFFQLEPERAILGDINADLMATYQEVRQNPMGVHRLLEGLPNESRKYYEIREIDPESLTQPSRAARFIYLNRFCFNGLYRTNQRGRFNVPYGGKKAGRLPSYATLQEASKLLQAVTLTCTDFAKTLEDVREGDFVYLDPPFSVSEKRVFSEYNASGFGEKDIARLRGCLRTMHANGVRFVLSYDESSEGESLAEGFQTMQVKTRRNIAGFSGNRKTATELLIFNDKPRRSGHSSAAKRDIW